MARGKGIYLGELKKAKERQMLPANKKQKKKIEGSKTKITETDLQNQQKEIK